MKYQNQRDLEMKKKIIVRLSMATSRTKKNMPENNMKCQDQI